MSRQTLSNLPDWKSNDTVSATSTSPPGSTVITALNRSARYSREAADRLAAARSPVRAHERLVVRQDIVSRRAEARPHLLPGISKIPQDGVRIVDLVGRRHAQARSSERACMFDVAALAVQPGLLRRRPRI